jgi:DNA-directed RNA polymerase specialized sigma24 family protein
MNSTESKDIADKVISQIAEMLSLKSSSPISPGLVIQMVRCRIYDELRKNKTRRDKRNDLKQQVQKKQEEIPDPQAEIQKAEELDRLRRAINKLDLASQGLIQLYLKLADENKQVSYRLMARVCKKSQWAVKNDLENIFTQLATWMSYDGNGKEK